MKRVAAICCFTPLAQLHEAPFLVDTRSQMAAVEEWAGRHGGTVVMQWITHRLEDRLAAESLPGIDVAVAPTRAVLERAVADVDSYTAILKDHGVELVVADAVEPVYTRDMLSKIYRRHSLPTAGYDGS